MFLNCLRYDMAVQYKHQNEFPDFHYEAKGFFFFLFYPFIPYPKNPLMTSKKNFQKLSHRWYWYHPEAGEKKQLKKQSQSRCTVSGITRTSISSTLVQHGANHPAKLHAVSSQNGEPSPLASQPGQGKCRHGITSRQLHNRSHFRVCLPESSLDGKVPNNQGK